MVSRRDGNKKFGIRPNNMALGPKTLYFWSENHFFLRYAHITQFVGVSGFNGRYAGRLGSSLVPLLLTLCSHSRHRLTSGVDLEREKTKH